MPLYPILDTALLARHGVALTDAVRLSLDHPLPYVQIRHKAAFDRPVLAAIEDCAKLPHRGRLILNDRADYARLFGLGLHLGQDDLPPAEARAILGPELPLGFSTHNAAQLEAAPYDLLTYVALGPIFGTQSKPNPDPEVGLEHLGAWRPISPLPLVAIGGLSLDSASHVLAGGADFLAVISALWPPPYTLKAFGHAIETWLKQLRALQIAPPTAPSRKDSAS